MSLEEYQTLDYTGEFDYWHTHLDWDGAGNLDLQFRLKCLRDFVALYETYATELTKRNRNFYLFIVFDGEDSGQDAIYIHTNPLTMELHKQSEIVAPRADSFKALAAELSRMGFDLFETVVNPALYAYRRGIGLSIVAS